MDFAGIATLTAGLTALVLALVQSNSWHWGSPRIVGLFVMAMVALAAFVVIELHARSPMLDLSLFRSRTSAGANAVGFLVTFAMRPRIYRGAVVTLWLGPWVFAVLYAVTR